jgi:predicted 2-oxoglutarate/Fe(II)-dependent dioxygenase YbiX
MLITIPNVLSTSEVSNYRAQLEQATWIEGSQTAGSVAGQVKQNSQQNTPHLFLLRYQTKYFHPNSTAIAKVKPMATT